MIMKLYLIFGGLACLKLYLIFGGLVCLVLSPLFLTSEASGQQQQIQPPQTLQSPPNRYLHLNNLKCSNKYHSSNILYNSSHYYNHNCNKASLFTIRIK